MLPSVQVLKGRQWCHYFLCNTKSYMYGYIHWSVNAWTYLVRWGQVDCILLAVHTGVGVIFVYIGRWNNRRDTLSPENFCLKVSYTCHQDPRVTDRPCFESVKSSKFKFKYLVKWPDYSSSYMELLFLTADICSPSQNNNPYLYVDCLHLTFKTLEIFWFRWYINWIKITISYIYSFNFWLKTITSLHICS